VIVGAGPVGSLTAALLARSGEDVRLISRHVDGADEMWNATDDRERRALAEEALTEDAVLLYPTFEAHNRNDAVALAGRFHIDTPGARIEVLSGVEDHHVTGFRNPLPNLAPG
jgi:saccharopine dehydrogenase-like NADP-dependent oxidoreductase